jgi:uncharacterized membrane protein
MSMYEGFDIWSFLVGLPLAIVIATVLTFYGWRKGKKQRLYDERYTRIHQHARSISWIVTTISILILWGIIIILEGPGLTFFLISGMWVVHISSYAIGAIIATRKN